MRCEKPMEAGRLLYCARCRASIDAPQPEETAARVHITKIVADDYYRREVFPMAHRPGLVDLAPHIARAMHNDAATRAGTAYRAHLKRLATALRSTRGGAAGPASVPDPKQAEMFV